MIFNTPNRDEQFEIPDEWWSFCDMQSFSPRSKYYPYDPKFVKGEIVRIETIRPPRRDPGVSPFKKYKIVQVLLAFTSPGCALPPVPARCIEAKDTYSLELIDGFHCFYASIAGGYSHLPVVISPNFLSPST